MIMKNIIVSIPSHHQNVMSPLIFKFYIHSLSEYRTLARNQEKSRAGNENLSNSLSPHETYIQVEKIKLISKLLCFVILQSVLRIKTRQGIARDRQGNQIECL